MNQGLSAAHQGYQYQDLVVASVLVKGVIESFDQAAVDRKLLPGDRFDDLEVRSRSGRRRIQIKSHTIAGRRLELSDLTTDRIKARMDALVSTCTADASPANEYRLSVTYAAPVDQELVECLLPDQSVDTLLPGVATQRYRVDPALVWPVGGGPKWQALQEGGIERGAFVDFCGRFVIETSLPAMSTDLRNPGPLEQVLLRQLRDDIGVGLWPNQDADPATIAASLLVAVTSARGESQILESNHVIRALGVRTDYGRVAQQFPLDLQARVERRQTLESLSGRLEGAPRLIVVGPPGSGKSWMLKELGDRARDAGHLVAIHYCYLDLDDHERLPRTEVAPMFGSLIAELVDAGPELAGTVSPRYAAGPRELEQVVACSLELDPDRPITLIVDGLDHVSRTRPGSVLAPGASAEVATELAALDLPAGVTLIVGSQPGAHLDPLLTDGHAWELPPWSRDEVATLANNLGLRQALDSVGIGGDGGNLVAAIAEKSAGNALYATYLCREVLRSLNEAQAGQALPLDVVVSVEDLPPFDADLRGYYQWLLEALVAETGTPWLAEMLAAIDFALDRTSLAEIRPEEAHRIGAGLSRLQPVLRNVAGQGGVRIYHESFQRFILAEVKASGVNLGPVLAPVVTWLTSLGFPQDARAFRFLLPLLAHSGRGEEVLERIGATFVADAVAHGHSRGAVDSNLAVAASVASERRDWTALTRIAHLSRAAWTCYEDKLTDEVAELYGRTFAELRSAQELADCLSFEGRATYSPRTGLLLCALVDDAGVVAPWADYISAYEREQATSDTLHGHDSDAAVGLARFRGQLRLRNQSVDLDGLVQFVLEDEPEALPDVPRICGAIGGHVLVRVLADRLPGGELKTLFRLEVAHREAAIGNAQGAAEEAQAVLEEGVSHGALRACIDLGAIPRDSSITHEELVAATRGAAAASAHLYPERVSEWLSLVKTTSLRAPELLPRVYTELGGEGWYRAWLRFAVDLARLGPEGGHALPLFLDLATDTDPFKGEPRACDLYPLWGLIHETLDEALSRLRDDEWPAAFEALMDVSSETTTWLGGTPSGPLTREVLLDLLSNSILSRSRAEVALELAEQLVGEWRQGEEFYETHALYDLRLAHLQHAAGDAQSAWASWSRASRNLGAYGYRRDTTIFELIDPIPAIGYRDSLVARELLAQLQPLVSAVRQHTDGKETRHAGHRWSLALVKVDPAGAARLFARRLALRGGRLDGAVEESIPALLDRACDHEVAPALVAGIWLATKSGEIDTILLALQRLSASAIERAREGWPLIAAAIEGDRLAFPDELNSRLSDFASLHGLAPSALDVEHLTNPDSTGQVDGVRQRTTAADYQPAFDADASPLRIVRDLKAWSWFDESRAGVDQLANGLGWRLVQLAEAGQQDVAANLLHHAANDISYWGRAEVLGDLGEGLARHDCRGLAARAFVLAYTSSRGGGGWFTFGGPECHDWIYQALELDEEAAMATLAAEVASHALRDNWGMTGYLVECFIAIDRLDAALAMWRAAYEVIAQRLPPLGPVGTVEVPYRPAETDGLSLSDTLVTLLVALLNHFGQDRKRVSATALATLIAHNPTLLVAGVREAMRTDLLVSSVLCILQAIDAYEQDPFPLTHELREELDALEGTDILGFRVLARRLLERVVGPRALRHPPPPPPPEHGDALDPGSLGFASRGRLERAEDLWPGFSMRVARSAEALLSSETVAEWMRGTLEAVQSPSDLGRVSHVWTIGNELFECTLHTEASQARVAAALAGHIAPRAEDEIASILLDDLDIALRSESSRVVRPPELLPSELQDDVFGAELITSGRWAGWYRVGHVETELLMDETGARKVAGKATVIGGMVFPARGVGLGDQLPLHEGLTCTWRGEQPLQSPPMDSYGLVAGLHRAWHPLGPMQVVCPHPSILDFGLRQPPGMGSLELADLDGNLAVVGRQWRMRPIGTRFLADELHRLVGADLLIRADVLEWLRTRSSAMPVYVQRVILE